MIIAIDGPAGSGKSTVAKLIAEKIGALYLDTGAIYRALTLKVIRNGIEQGPEKLIVELARDLDVYFNGSKIFLDSEDVSAEIRSPQIEKNISRIAAIPKVREFMVKLQRSIASKSSCVVEGRDITTVVFPDAEFKFYLDAEFLVRANRRLKDFQKKGISISLQDVKDGLKRRDDSDTNRKVGALKLDKKAVYLDTTGLGIKEVVNTVCRIIGHKDD